jgi:hypothetical protein
MIHVDPALIASAPRPAPAAATADARALIEGQLAMLTHLAQIGMGIAEACGREAARANAPADPDAADPSPPRDPVLAFARVARAVRMTIALQSRLAKDLAALDRAAVYAEADRRRSLRTRLHGLVGEAARTLVEARRKAEGQYWGDEDAAEVEIEQMAEVAYERLIDAEDGGLDGATFDEAVAGVCRDLGLSPDRTARLLAAVEPPPRTPHEPPAAPPPDADPDADPKAGLGAQPPPQRLLVDGDSVLTLDALADVPPAQSLEQGMRAQRAAS